MDAAVPNTVPACSSLFFNVMDLHTVDDGVWQVSYYDYANCIKYSDPVQARQQPGPAVPLTHATLACM